MYTLKQPVPLEKRFEVYRKAIEIYKEALEEPNKEFFGMNIAQGIGLCLLLPCLLWDLKSYLDDPWHESNWSHTQTPIAFPEIKSYIKELNVMHERSDKIKRRIEILEEIIKNEEVKN